MNRMSMAQIHRLLTWPAAFYIAGFRAMFILLSYRLLSYRAEVKTAAEAWITRARETTRARAAKA